MPERNNMHRRKLTDEWGRDHAISIQSSTLKQITSYFPHSKRPFKAAKRFMEEEVREGRAITKTFMVSWPIPEIREPVFTYDPPLVPNFDPVAISNMVRSRYRNCPLRTVRLFAASQKTLRRFGGWELKSDFPNHWHDINHDLVTTAAAYLLRENAPEDFADLKHELLFYRHYLVTRDKTPDSIVCDGVDYLRPRRILESAGSYNDRHLTAFWRRHGPESDNPTPFDLF